MGIGSLQHQWSLFWVFLLLATRANSLPQVSFEESNANVCYFLLFLCFSQMYREITLLLPANQKLSLFFIRKWNDHKSFEPSVLGGPIYCFMISFLLRHLALGRFLEVEQIYIDNLPRINTFVTDFKNQMKTLPQMCFNVIWQINNIWTENIHQQHGFITKF